MMAEWYEFLYKEKYSGEVYLELTFYSNVSTPSESTFVICELCETTQPAGTVEVIPGCRRRPIERITQAE